MSVTVTGCNKSYFIACPLASCSLMHVPTWIPTVLAQSQSAFELVGGGDFTGVPDGALKLLKRFYFCPEWLGKGFVQSCTGNPGPWLDKILMSEKLSGGRYTKMHKGNGNFLSPRGWKFFWGVAPYPLTMDLRISSVLELGLDMDICRHDTNLVFNVTVYHDI